MYKRLAILIAASICLSSALLQAQNVLTLPGATATGQTVSVYSANPLFGVTSFNSGPSSFIALEKPDGSKTYIVASSGSQPVTVVDSTFSNPRTLGGFSTQATAAALTPNGKRLVVVAASVHVFDTTTDNDLLPAGLAIPGVSAFDVALSLDGSKAFILGRVNGGGSQLNVVDLNSNTLLPNSLSVLGNASGVALGLNGLLYVSTQNQILEVNPSTLTITPSGTISLNARPGKLVFTPDGRYGLAVNSTPITGQSILLIDLATHTVAGFIPNFQVTMDSLLVASSGTIYAYSSQNQSLYQLTVGTGGSIRIDALSLAAIPSNTVTAATLSNEIAAGGRTTAQYLFIVSGGTLYRVDLTQSQVSGQVPVSAQSAAIAYVTAAQTLGPPATLLQYGDNQLVAPGGTSLPLVARLLDSQGRPLSGVTVTFTPNNPAATVSPATFTTGADGFAQTIVTAPPGNGVVLVSATAGTISGNFTLSVGTGATGGATAGISIIAGQGQLTFENNNTGINGFGSPFVVQVNDLNGQPVVGTPVIFNIIQGQGQGTLFSAGMGAATGVSVLTDATGQAAASFLTGPIPPGTGFAQAVITASAAGTGTVTFYITITPMNSPALVQFLKPQRTDTFSGQAGTTIKGAFVAKVVSSQGLPIPNVVIRINPNGDPAVTPTGTCDDPTGNGALSDANGTVTCDLDLNGKIGSTTITANVGNAVDFGGFPLTITAGPPKILKIAQGNNQSGKPGQVLPVALRVQVSDGFGNLLGGVPLTWTVTPTGLVTLSNISSSTDQLGGGSALATLGNTAGTANVKVTAGGVSVTFTLTINIPTTGIQKVSGDAQTTLINTPFPAPLVVKVVDANGNGVNGAQVTFTVTGGSGAIAGTQTVTADANGQASVKVNAGATAGNISVAATSSNFTANFTLTSQVPGPQNVMFLNGASFQRQDPAPGVIAPGTITIITGTGIAPGVQGVVSAFNIVGSLPTTLAGVSVTFNGIFAPIFYVANVNGQESIALQVPFEIQPGPVTVTIFTTGAGGGTATINAQAQPYNPGVFESLYGNQKIAVALRPDGSYVSPTNPARRGEVIRVFVTGLGQVSPATSTNQAGISGQTVLASMVVGLNNSGVPLISAEYSSGQVGVYVIKIMVPSNTQTGPAQPFGLIVTDSAGNLYFAPSTFIPIQ